MTMLPATIRTALTGLLALVLLSGCAHFGKFSNSWDTYDQHKHAACAVYSSGSTIGGGASSLLLFSDGHYETWGMSCTEALRRNVGKYQWDRGQLLLESAGRPTQKLYRFTYKNRQLLATREERRAFLEGPTEWALEDIYEKSPAP